MEEKNQALSVLDKLNNEDNEEKVEESHELIQTHEYYGNRIIHVTKGLILPVSHLGPSGGNDEDDSRTVIFDARRKFKSGQNIKNIAKSLREVMDEHSFCFVICDVNRINKNKKGVEWNPSEVISSFYENGWILYSSIVVTSSMSKRRYMRLSTSYLTVFVFTVKQSYYVEYNDKGISDSFECGLIQGKDDFDSHILVGTFEEFLESIDEGDHGRGLIVNPCDTNAMIAFKNFALDYDVVVYSDSLFEDHIKQSKQKTIRETLREKSMKGQFEI